jgi:putative transcriptional regulator
LIKNNIKVERAKKDLTQAKLAELVKVSRQTINAIEANKYVPSTVLALRLSAIFECRVEDIFSLESEEE